MGAPRVIAQCGSEVLWEDGERWSFGEQPGAGGEVPIYVVGLLAFILGANGMAQLVMAARGGTGLIAGLVLAAVTGPLVAVLVHLVKRRRRARASGTLQPLLVLDFAAGQLLDARGTVLAPLHEVSFDSVMQLASSSRALKCRWGKDGELVVLRGSPFAGGIGPAVDALRTRGLMSD